MAGGDRSAVIIGGGITGALVARELADDGWQVTVLEAAHVGAGSSSRSAAAIRQQFSTPSTVRGARYAVSFYERFTEIVGGTTSPIQQNGYLFLQAGDLEPARRRVRMQHQVGLTDAEVLTADEVVRRFPWVDGTRITGASFCPTDGFLLPDVIYSEGMEAAKRLGATVLQRAPVTGARHVAGRLAEVQTPRGSFGADLFIDATNAWARRTAAILGAEVLQVDPLKRYLWFLVRGGGLSGEQLAAMPMTIAPSGVYCRPENADTLLIGKKHETPPEPDFTYEDQDVVEPGFSHTSGIDAIPFGLWAELAEILPAIGEFDGFSATTCGYYGTSPDQNPFLGFDRQVPNLIRLVGFSGRGAMLGPFSALVARNLAAAGRDLDAIETPTGPVELASFRIGRPYDHSEELVI